MFLLYDIFFIIFALLYLPYLLIEGKWHRGFIIRFGFWPPELKERLKGKRNIWFHAVSVGEILAVQSLIKRVRENYPDFQLVISTVTETGFNLAQTKFPTDVVLFAPLDFSIVVHNYVRWIKPEIYINAETEIWPNLLACLKRRRIPAILVNGRISERSFVNYEKVRFLLKNIFDSIYTFCMQGQEDAKRIIDLGAPPEKVKVFGNMKFDEVPLEKHFTLTELGFEKNSQILLAGSTHPGEEEVLFDIFNSISAEFPKLRLMIAPRHIERTQEIVDLLKAKGLEPILWTQIKDARLRKDSVVVVDTIGDLRSLYPLATLVFIGKSLKGYGGQNMIEPACFGRAIIVGPNMQNFKDIFEYFVKAKAVMQVRDEVMLLTIIRRLLHDEREREELGIMAKQVIAGHKGATTATLNMITDILSGRREKVLQR